MQLLVLLITAAVPLAIAPGLLSAFDITPKIAILLFCESLILLFCKQLVKGAQAISESSSGRLFMGCLASLWLSTLASTMVSSNPSLSVVGSSWRRDGLIAETTMLMFSLIVLAWFVEDPGRIRLVLRASALAGTAGSLYGISQYFGWDPFLPQSGYLSGDGPFTIVRPPGTLGHADYFADWLLMIVFLALALSRKEDRRGWKWIARATMALATLAIILSGTRSALLGLLAGAIVFAVIARPRIDRNILLMGAAAIVFLGGLYISPAGAKLRARVHWSVDDVRGGARMLLWRDSIRMAAQRPLLGFGPETFTAQFPPFESVELSRAYPDFYHESPHNMFLDALTSRGIFGLLALLALCAVASRCARNCAALAGGLAGAIVCQQFIVLTIPTALYFYLLISMLLANTVPAGTAEARPFPRAVLPVAAITAIVFLVFAARLIAADRAMAVAERSAASGDAERAAKAYRTARRWAFSPNDSDLRYSRAMTGLAAKARVFPASVEAAQQAYEAAVRATETSEDRQNAWYNLATIDALRNDRGGVEMALRGASSSAPHWFKPHWALAQLLELTGRHADARREASVALELDGGHDPEVTDTAHKILAQP